MQTRQAASDVDGCGTLFLFFFVCLFLFVLFCICLFCYTAHAVRNANCSVHVAKAKHAFMPLSLKLTAAHMRNHALHTQGYSHLIHINLTAVHSCNHGN